MLLSFELINSLIIHPYNGVDDHKLKKNLLTISENFTKDRSKIGAYLETDEMVSAYTTFYFPTGFVKLGWLLERLPEKLRESLRTKDFIDIGAGPGTFSAAFLSFAGESYSGRVSAIETSKAMGRQASATMAKLFPKAQFSVNQSITHDNGRIVFFGNSLNEMGIDKARSYIKKFAPEVIIFIEPGTKDVFKEILPLREKILQDGYHVAYPCPAHGTCPMQSSEDWCHQVMETTHDPSIEQLSQILHKDRRSMPMIAHVYVKDSSLIHLSARIVRTLPETKFSYEFQLCMNEEGNKLVRFETMTKKYDKSQKKKIEQLCMGDALEVTHEKILNDGKVRGSVLL